MGKPDWTPGTKNLRTPVRRQGRRHGAHLCQGLSPAGLPGTADRGATGAPAREQQAPAKVESKGRGKKTQDGVCKQKVLGNGMVVRKEWTMWVGGSANLKKEAHNMLHGEQVRLFEKKEKKSVREKHIRDTNKALEKLKEDLHLNNPETDRDWTMKLHELTRDLEPYFAKREEKYNCSDKSNPISVSYETRFRFTGSESDHCFTFVVFTKSADSRYEGKPRYMCYPNNDHLRNKNKIK